MSDDDFPPDHAFFRSVSDWADTALDVLRRAEKNREGGECCAVCGAARGHFPGCRIPILLGHFQQGREVAGA